MEEKSMSGALKSEFCILPITLRLGTKNNSLETEMWVANGLPCAGNIHRDQ
jgi:hypothetical protein